jgi:hypothetical protein
MQDLITVMVAARLMTRAISEDEFYRRHVDPMPRPFRGALRWTAGLIRALSARSSGRSKACLSLQDDHGKACQQIA